MTSFRLYKPQLLGPERALPPLYFTDDHRQYLTPVRWM